jgi:hypothetical protein
LSIWIQPKERRTRRSNLGLVNKIGYRAGLRSNILAALGITLNRIKNIDTIVLAPVYLGIRFRCSEPSKVGLGGSAAGKTGAKNRPVRLWKLGFLNLRFELLGLNITTETGTQKACCQE